MNNRYKEQRRIYVLAVLFCIYVLASIDRQILAVMVEPVKAQFNLLDTQVSLLLGLAFIAAYIPATLPAARLADRHSRRTLIAVGLAIWSISTAAFALARSYWQLIVFRMGVGLGEACLNPAAIPLLAEFFSSRHLGKAVGVYMLAVPVGNGLANMLGSYILARQALNPDVDLPVVGNLMLWQVALLLLSCIGLLLIVLLRTIREPARAVPATPTLPAPPLGEPLQAVTTLLAAHKAVFIALAMPLIASALMYFGVGYWIPAWLVRNADSSGVSASDLVFYWGAINLAVGSIGVISGGLLADYLSARHQDGMWKTLGIGTVLLGLGFALFTLAGDPAAALLILIPGVLGNGILQAAGVTTVLKLTPNSMRGQVSALYFVLVNLVGAGLGPTVVAVLSDFVFVTEHGLALAMALTAAVSTSVAGLCLYRTADAYRKMQVE